MFSVANVCVLGCLPPVAGLEGNKITPALRWLAPAMRFLERLTVDRGQHGYEVGWGDGERSIWVVKWVWRLERPVNQMIGAWKVKPET